MKTSSYSISIPKPCHENLADMAPSETGRYCTACQKNVIDFSKMTDAQIIRVLQKNTSLCGSVHTQQLDRILYPQAQATKQHGWQQLLIAMAIGFSSFRAEAAPGKKVMETAQNPVNKIPNQNDITIPGPDQKPETITITGRITDSSDGSPLLGVVVMLSSGGNTLLRVVTDLDGKYSCTIKNTGDLSLACHYIGYDIKSIRIDKNMDTKANFELNATLTESLKMMGGAIVITKVTPRQKFRYFMWRLFHKRGTI